MLEFSNDVAVKVCGITNLEDAMACALANVEMIGLNLAPQSARCISRAKATEIIAAVRAKFAQTRFVAVFVNQERESVRSLAQDLGFDAVQLHGDESPDYVRSLRMPFVVKALRVGPQFEAAGTAAYADCDAILLDNWSPGASGGTGQSFPWPVAVAVRPLVRRLILAGGLTPGNIAEAVKLVRPFAVDVCSGVEDAPGRKNHTKILRFLEAVRKAGKATV